MKIANEKELTQFLREHAPQVPEAPENEWEILASRCSQNEMNKKSFLDLFRETILHHKMATSMGFAMVLSLSFYGVRVMESQKNNHLIKLSGAELQKILDFSPREESHPIGRDWL